MPDIGLSNHNCQQATATVPFRPCPNLPDCISTIRFFFAYNRSVSQHRICSVSFTDSEGISHAVEVPAASLYEAAALGVAQFRRASLYEIHIGPGTLLRVAVKQSEAEHTVRFAKLQEWLDGGAKSPNELVLKRRLKEALAGV